ncbi:MAG: isopeptide-forming domain-containing fimbrial protein [Lachnospiraceae bacterium]|nr:isopeptide-forming domain-containing fimbrial protein [Lachnospiraceae bacterium]
MKRTLKKWIALASVVIMMLAMTMSVSATTASGGGTGDLTLNIYDHTGNASGNTYSLYQIAKFDVETLNEKTVYTNIVVNEAYKDSFSVETISAYSDNDSNMKALAVTLKNIALDSGTSAPVCVASDIDDGIVTGLASGYYLLVETAHATTDAYIATDVILVAVDGQHDVNDGKYNNVTLKETDATVTKKIVLEDSSTNVAGSKDDLVDANVAAIGDTVTYKLESEIPNYPADAKDITYIITDTLSTGLDYVGVTSIVITTTAGASATYTVGGTQNNCADWIDTTHVDDARRYFTITVPPDIVLANVGATVTVTFTAELNEDAAVGSTGNPNSVKLTYTNNWDKKTTYTTDEDSVITYTGTLTIEKVDSTNTTTKLGGATFAIYSAKDHKKTVPSGDDNKGETATITVGDSDPVTYYYYTTVTTSSDNDETLGTATIDGLDADTYYAVELVAPAGYSVDSTKQKLELTVSGNSGLTLETTGDPVSTKGNTNTANGNTVTWAVNGVNGTTKQIQNTQGKTLPGTGGIGTTLFTFGGLALVIIAAVMFIVYTKKQRKQA